MTDVIKSKRLILRRHELADAAEMARLIGDWDVISWLTTPPYPYGLADAEWFLNDDMSAETFAITMDGQYLGNVGLHGVSEKAALEFGFWLGKPYWGQGLMTEAAKAVIGDHFGSFDSPLLSGYLKGNAASDNVLRKLRFRNTEIVMRDSVPQGKNMQLQRMELTAEVWRARDE